MGVVVIIAGDSGKDGGQVVRTQSRCAGEGDRKRLTTDATAVGCKHVRGVGRHAADIVVAGVVVREARGEAGRGAGQTGQVRRCRCRMLTGTLSLLSRRSCVHVRVSFSQSVQST